jgi:hypothetical protein
MSLIIDLQTEALWASAQTQPECATTRFWEYVLKEQFFKGRNWTISSQQPPTNDPDDKRRVDLRIERWKTNRWQTIALFEAKKQNCSQTEIDELEFQAFNACMAHLIYSGREQMYGITTIGTAARLWYITKDDDYLLPLVPETGGLSNRKEYIEANSTEAADLKKGFNYMIQNDMISSRQLQVLRSKCSPKPQPPVGANNQYGGPAALLTYGLQPSPNPAQPQWPNIAVPTRQAVYALPATQNPTLYSTTSGSQAYTMTSVQNNNNDGEGDDGDITMESSPGLDNEPELNYEKALYVNVTRKVVKHMLADDEVLYCFKARDQKRETSKSQWRSSTVMGTIGGKTAVVPCVVYTSKTGTQYYTYALPVGKGKGKA